MLRQNCCIALLPRLHAEMHSALVLSGTDGDSLPPGGSFCPVSRRDCLIAFLAAVLENSFVRFDWPHPIFGTRTTNPINPMARWIRLNDEPMSILEICVNRFPSFLTEFGLS